MIEWMTANVLPWSYETENWHEPPMWVAPPGANCTSMVPPAERVATGLSVAYASGVL